MPIRDWKAALNRFAIQFKDRVPQTYTKTRLQPKRATREPSTSSKTINSTNRAACRLHGLYWKGDHPAQGQHHEVGLKTSYVFQGGPLKQGKITLTSISHRVSSNYPAKSFRDLNLKVDMPFRAL
jgi:hypothetical protein